MEANVSLPCYFATAHFLQRKRGARRVHSWSPISLNGDQFIGTIASRTLRVALSAERKRCEKHRDGEQKHSTHGSVSISDHLSRIKLLGISPAKMSVAG